MNILVLGGMHGNEPLGPEIVCLLRARNSSIDTMLANEQALQADARFIETDLNRSFPGDLQSASYEAKRAAELLQACKGYDVVLDFHNTHCPNNDCTFVGDTAVSLLFDVSAQLGLKRVVVADYDCINKYVPNCISIEISLTSGRMDANTWVKVIERLAQMPTIPRAESLDTYQFVYRMTLQDKERLVLDEQGLEAFVPIKAELANALGVTSPAYPIFVADKYTPYNFGGLLNRIEV